MSAEKQPHPTLPDRWADGSLRAGNQAARTHGVRAFEIHGAASLPADLRISVDDFQAAIISDLGGLECMTAIEGMLVRRLVELETVSRLLGGDISRKGLFTLRGRVRNVVARWQETTDRQLRVARELPRERRAKFVNPLDAVRAAVEEANRDVRHPVDQADDERPARVNVIETEAHR